MPSAAPPGIGTTLRQARLERSLSIEETAWRTRIRPETLRALEGDDFEVIGHRSFVRSHLRSYARFLGIDAGEMVEAFTALHADERSALEELELRRKRSRKPPRPKWLIAATVCGALLVAAGAVGVLGGQAERPAAVPSPQQSLPELVASASGLPVPAAEARVRLHVEALEAATVSVLADGQPLYEGTIPGGSSRTFNAREALEILLPDAGAVRLRLNGRSLGTPGERGAVFRQRYGPDGPIAG